MNHHTLLKTTTSTSMIAVLLTITTGCVTAPGYNAYGDLYEDIYKDSKVYKKHKKTINSIDKELYQPAIEQRAANKVSNMGYRVKDVKYKKGDSKIKVKAKRGSEDYKIELGYPSYNVIKIKKD
ncbi:hypothetical protein JCM18903_1152 [Psychrobacter sp. JCM 18903]|uniref:hypothetical protein n=1 Tax=Psychrobacter sp. JCM 18903 TaxID=1298610 RepID=UPI0004322B5E|nr:hypothetical protein [Psychrobacter sp. JCM 18903]WLG13964.1 hypothetical protein Q6344_00980 [Psychrobacter cibarius]GAF61182.1 hypothetical protein JCM18903_1152 [Psychrobacter sp. JCM 18903]